MLRDVFLQTVCRVPDGGAEGAEDKFSIQELALPVFKSPALLPQHWPQKVGPKMFIAIFLLLTLLVASEEKASCNPQSSQQLKEL